MRSRRVLAAALVLGLAATQGAHARGQLPPGLTQAAVDELIANARPDTPATLRVANRPITVLRAAMMGRTPIDRVAAAERIIATLTADGERREVGMRPVGAGAIISVGSRDVFAIVPADSDDLIGETVEAKATEAVGHLRLALDEIAETRQPRVILRGAAEAALMTIVFAVILWVLLRLNRWAGAAAARRTAQQLSKMRVSGELTRSVSVQHYAQRLISVSLSLVAIGFAYLWFAFVLRRFPYTRPWGESLRGFLLDRIVWFGRHTLDAVPNLFTVFLIFVAVRLAIRLVQIVFAALEEGRLTMPGLHQETASTTRKLITALVWVFGIVMAYPYLPGSGTEAFKGASVFVGLMVSLGSTGLVNQIMSGLTLTYSRALRRGDYVRVGKVEGTVTQLGTLSTKIETPLREEVTIPNAVLVTQEVINFSRNAGPGVFVGTAVTIGYDAPWRKVQALLLAAAAATEGVRKDVAPVVFQSALEDFYVRYTLLVSLDNPAKRGPILNRLHANIQDAFNDSGIQIMSPRYEADPVEKKIVPKDQWFT